MHPNNIVNGSGSNAASTCNLLSNMRFLYSGRVIWLYDLKAGTTVVMFYSQISIDTNLG